MPGITLNDHTDRILTTAMDGLTARQRVSANNIANLDTPGFKAGQVSFEAALQQARQNLARVNLVSTNPQHLGTPGETGETEAIEVTTRTDTSHRLDGNNVDLEKEMANLAETTIAFQATTRLLSLRLGMLRSAVNEGRGG